MAVLLMFNDSAEYTIGTLVENLKLKKEVLVQVVQALVKFQLLEMTGGESGRKSPSTESSSSIDKDAKDATPDLPDDALLRLNTKFSKYALTLHCHRLHVATFLARSSRWTCLRRCSEPRCDKNRSRSTRTSRRTAKS
jgi:hypothetical protein